MKINGTILKKEAKIKIKKADIEIDGYVIKTVFDRNRNRIC